jgi:hypothetical protein
LSQAGKQVFIASSNATPLTSMLRIRDEMTAEPQSIPNWKKKPKIFPYKEDR